jgi:hypothetical protein
MRLQQELDLFFGKSSDALTRVYARLKPSGGPPPQRLAGRIVGPFSRSGRTLAATVAFRELPAGETLLAEALVPDMCCWSPQQPHLYRVHVELVRHDGSLESVEREWGVRRLAPHGTRLYWNAQPWRLEAEHVSAAISDLELDDWRQTGRTPCLAGPPDALCREASRMGVALLAVVRTSGSELLAEIRRLARWPAVVMALVEGQSDPDTPLNELAPNLILAAWNDAAGTVPSWAQVLFRREPGPRGDLPVVGVGAPGEPSDELAGYVVWK